MFFSYTLRNLAARRVEILPTLLAITATVGIAAALFASLEGLYAALDQSGSPDNAIVMERGARYETESTLQRMALARVALAPGVATHGGTASISNEFVTQLNLRQVSGQLSSVTLRGVEAIAFQVHPGVRLISGQLPQPGHPGVLVGARQLGRFEGLTEGGYAFIGRKRWPVVGVFEAPGTRFESELWTDRTALMAELRRDASSMAVVVLEGEQHQAGFAEAVARIADQPLEAQSEREYYRRAAAGLEIYLRAIALAIAVLGLGAVFACTSAMYTSFLGRRRELATLIVIGHRPLRVSMLVAQESLVLAFVGGALGLALAWLVDGHTFTIEIGVGDAKLGLAYTALLSRRVALAACGTAALVGVLGGLVPTLYALRLPVLKTLRD
jgi:putative ABC transport system permease protein